MPRKPPVIPAFRQLATSKPSPVTEIQARELEITIQHAHDDLKGFYKTRIGRGPRKAKMDRLKAVDQALAKLISLLGRNPERINEDHGREAIAWCASCELISGVTGEKVSDAGRRVPHREQAAGLNYGARLLAAQLRLIRDPTRSVLTEKGTDPGGVEPNHSRAILIRALAAAAPDIVGRRATGTAGGKFEKLVGKFFEELGIETGDLSKTIENTLYRKPSPSKKRK